MKYLNLGCGERFHPDWTNVDIVSTGPNVIAHDLSRGVPLADGVCDVVYHSHVLEHIRRPDALPFMKECCRVLKPGGILRVAVPDLETISRLYLEKLQAALAGDSASAHDYQWMVLEMYDQTVREHWKSEMWHYLHASNIPNEPFVRQRIGQFRGPLAAPLTSSTPSGQTARARAIRPGRQMIKWFVEHLLWIKMVRAFAIGRFRLKGEIHQWMYDRYSLAQLMKAAGLVEPTQQSATTSLIPEWGRFHLDVLSDGTAYKPDSLFMEARKPS